MSTTPTAVKFHGYRGIYYYITFGSFCNSIFVNSLSRAVLREVDGAHMASNLKRLFRF